MQFFCENQSPVLRQHVKDAVSCLKLIDKTNFDILTINNKKVFVCSYGFENLSNDIFSYQKTPILSGDSISHI